MKKLFTLAAAVAFAGATFTSQAVTWAMPGTYQSWKLETNHFTDNGDGTWSQVIEDLYGDFKIVMFESSPNWDNEYGSSGSEVTDGVAYQAKFKGGNIVMAGSADNLHYYNAKVTITPGADNALTILVQAERVAAPADKWQLVGDEPLPWDFSTAPEFVAGEDGVFTLAYEGTLLEGKSFKVGRNGLWSNCYSTKEAVVVGTPIVLDGPGDFNYNINVPAGGLENPVFTLTTGDTVTLTITVGQGVEGIEADTTDAPAVYYNLQGRQVENPESGLYIRLQGGKATKVIL